MNGKTSVGSIISGISDMRESISVLREELQRVGSAEHSELLERSRIPKFLDRRVLSIIFDELSDALNDLSPPHCFFGQVPPYGEYHYGFWIDWDSLDDVKKFDDLSEVPEDFRGEFMVVNDHGNTTLYSTWSQYVEEWAVV